MIPRQITSATPLRIWVIGDSLAGPVGYALSRQLRDTELAGVTVDHIGGSGLTNPGYLDWPALIRDRLGEVRPDAVVVHIGANDARAMWTPEGWSQVGTEAWDLQYRLLAGEVLDRLLASADRVIWVGAPIMGNRGFSTDVQSVNAAARAEAEARPGVLYVDAYQAFSTPDGEYARYLPGEDGALVQLRSGDGIHYTSAGAEFLAEVVRPVVLYEWRVWLPAVE